MKYRTYEIISFLFIIFILLFLAFGCKTTKYIDREVVKIDSAVVEQNEGLQRALKETIEIYEREREQWEKTGILFDTVYRDTGSLKIIPKVVFDNGKIKSVEGRLLSVNQAFFEKSSGLLNAHSTIDSMAVELERKDIALSKKQETLIKEVKRTVWPFWLFAACFIGGLICEYRFKIIKSILSFIKLRS